MNLCRRNILIGLVTILVATCWLKAASVAASGAWSNEPAGFSVILDCPMTNSLCPGMWDGNLASGWSPARFANLGTTKLSSPYVADSFMAAGTTSGGNWFGIDFSNTQEIFVGTWWATNPDFTGMINNDNKMIFVNGTGNAYISWQGQPNTNRELIWAQIDCDNSHLGQPDSYLAGVIRANVGHVPIAPGSGWHRIEMYQKASTTCSSRDGTLRMWVDGIQTHNFTNVNGNPGGFRDVQINHTWDGNSTCDGRRDCSKEWHHYFDHLYVSAGGGASSADQPPGPPAIVSNMKVSVP